MRSVVIPGILALACSSVTIADAARGVQGQARKVYVSVTEKNGTPVTDLTAADFDIKEGGKSREVVGAQLTKTPVRMALIIADGGTGGFQYAAATFIQRLQEVAEFSIVSAVEQPDKVVDYTTDLDAVVAGLKRLGTRTGKPTSGQLMEAISETLKDVRKENKRPVVIVLTMGGAAASPIRAAQVREDLRTTGTLLYVVSPIGSSAGRGASAGGGGSGNMGAARTDYAASESADRGRDLEVVLNDGSKETGGRHEQVSAQTLAKIAEQMSQEILSQYEVSYSSAEGTKAGDKLEVSSKRKNLKVNAPTRVAN